MVNCTKEIKSLKDGLSNLTESPVFARIPSYGADVVIEVHKAINNLDELSSLRELENELSDKVRSLTKEIWETKKELATSVDLTNPNAQVRRSAKFVEEYDVKFGNLFMYDMLDFNDLPEPIKDIYDRGLSAVKSAVGKIVANGGGDISQSIKGTLVRNNPAYGLLLNYGGGSKIVETDVDSFVDNHLNKGVLLGLTMGTFYGLNDMYVDLVAPSSGRDDRAIRAIAGLGKDAEIPSELRNFLYGGGVNVNIASENIGSSVVDLLGIKAKIGTAELDSAELTNGFGVLGVQLLSELGVIKNMEGLVGLEAQGSATSWEDAVNGAKQDPTVSPVGEYIDRYVFIDDKFRNSTKFVNRLNSVVRDMDEFLEVDNTNLRAPSFEIPKTGKTRIRRRRYSNPSKMQEKFIEELNKVPYSYNEGFDQLWDMYGGNLEEIAKRLGHSGIFDIEGNPNLEVEQAKRKSFNGGLSKDKADSIESKDRAIIRTINHLVSFKEEAGDKDFYFKWFIGANDRTMIDSNTVNPLADKELARWLITPRENTYEVSVDEVVELLNSDLDNMKPDDFISYSDQVKVFLYGLVQAFDGYTVNGMKIPATDAAHFTDVLKAAKEITSSDPDMLTDMVMQVEVKDSVYSGKGHIGQQAVAIKALKETVGKAVISTSLVFEVDGKTNGLGHKSLQMPNLDYKGYLLKVGVMFEDQIDAENDSTLADVVSVKGQPGKKKVADAYQTMVGTLHDELKGFINAVKTIDNNTTRTNLAPITKAVSNGLVIDLLDKDLSSALEEISGAHRNYAKSSALEGMYGAAISTLILNKVIDASDKLISAIVESGYDAEGNWTSPFGLTEVNVLYLFNYGLTYYKTTGSDSEHEKGEGRDRPGLVKLAWDVKREKIERPIESVRELIDRYKQHNSYSMVNKDYTSNLRSHLEVVLNDAITVSMADFFGDQQRISSAVNSMMGSMFEMFLLVYEHEANQLAMQGGHTSLSEVQKDSLVSKIIKAVPSVRRASSVFDDEKVVFVKNGGKKSSIYPSNVKAVYNLGSKSALANIVAYVFEKGWKGPEAGTLPIATHHKDNDDMMKSFLDVVEEGKSRFLAIFDAITMSAGNVSAANTLNKNFIEGNLSYSLLGELLNALNNSKKYIEDTYGRDRFEAWELGVAETERVRLQAKLELEGRKSVEVNVPTFSEKLTTFGYDVSEYERRRGEIFRQNLNVGQFVGMPGSTFKYDPKKTLNDSLVRHKQSVTEVLEALDSPEMKKAAAELAIGRELVADLVTRIASMHKNPKDGDKVQEGLLAGKELLALVVGMDKHTKGKNRDLYEYPLLDLVESGNVIRLIGPKKEVKLVKPSVKKARISKPKVSDIEIKEDIKSIEKEIRKAERKLDSLWREHNIVNVIASAGGVHIDDLSGIDWEDVKHLKGVSGTKFAYTKRGMADIDGEDRLREVLSEAGYTGDLSDVIDVIRELLNKDSNSIEGKIGQVVNLSIVEDMTRYYNDLMYLEDKLNSSFTEDYKNGIVSTLIQENKNCKG